MKHDAFSQYHPLVCFLFFTGAIGFGVVIQHPAYLLAGAVGAGGYYLLLKGRGGWKLIGGLLPVFIVVSAINPLFNTYGNTMLFSLWGRPYTLEALFHGMAVSSILVIMLLWFGCYNAVLTGDKFTALFGRLIPALSLLLVMVLRMIPSLRRKTAQIANARRTVGKGVRQGDAPKEKLRSGMQVLSALTDWALEGSVVTADSMRARGYGSAKRSSFQIYRIAVRDWILLGLMILLAGAVLLAGGTSAGYTPSLSISTLTWGFGPYCAYLLLPTILHIYDSALWHISRSRI